jgi:hypothetical protein
MSREERTGWRDDDFSQRHRRWGSNCPMLDFDMLVGEYDDCRLVAMIEYKHEFSTNSIDPTEDPNVMVLIDAANRCEQMAFVVRYANSYEWYQIYPLSERSKRSLKMFRKYYPDFESIKHREQDGKNRWTVTEKGFITYLYWLRYRELPISLKFNEHGLLIWSEGDEVPGRIRPFVNYKAQSSEQDQP